MENGHSCWREILSSAEAYNRSGGTPQTYAHYLLKNLLPRRKLAELEPELILALERAAVASR